MRVEVLGAPVDLGADRRGVDMGPSAIRYAALLPGLELLGHTVRDLGNLPMLLPDTEEDPGSETAKYLAPIVGMAAAIRDSVREIVDRSGFPLILGGDHSVSLGSVSGVGTPGACGVIWLDAHGDFNTPETSPSGNVHGMVLAALAGFGDVRMTAINGDAPTVPPERIALIGVRELDPGERRLLRESGVHVFTMSDVDEVGLAGVVAKALEALRPAVDALHLSLDMDVVDPIIAPGVGTPVPGGLSYREAQLAMEVVGATGLLKSMDVVEVNPILDQHNQTAVLAVDLISSALGKRIL